MFNFLVFSWALTLGFVPQQQDLVDATLVQIDSSRVATVAALEIGATAWNRLHVYTEVETFQYTNDGSLSFSPYRADYTFGADFYISKMMLLGLTHECDHSVINTVNLTSKEYISSYRYAKNETKIFVKIGNEVRAR